MRIFALFQKHCQTIQTGLLGEVANDLMMSFSRDMFQAINNRVQQIAEALHLAVPAVNQKKFIPRWRNLGRPITPYHYMRPALVPVRQQRTKA